MSALMEQHSAWAEARHRLWYGRPERRKLASAPRVVARPAPPMVVLPRLFDDYGWPVYRNPAIYEIFVGEYIVTPKFTWRSIANEVCKKHGVSMEDLLSPRRSVTVVAARHEAFWRCRQETTMSLPQIGKRFGGRDHSTVIHGIHMHERRMREAQNG